MKKRGLQCFIFILSIFFLSSSVTAEFDANKGFSWLVGKSSNGNYGDIQTTAVAAVALAATSLLVVVSSY